ncbi:ABC transporter substrate-binding protein [Nitratireductor sp. L1-7-SE]|uniref:ABC transporter substrate-binding protein n=2 Tax=Nitratireductor TaxID=245876 RepID=A0ABS7RB18_9HYPH|nr:MULTISPECIES: ABC transporter substrate-binding protein [Nitratireductor]EIM71733.1 putative sulfonate transport system substrate-binding protein [Nitratireductor aquibiodomus RA22]MBY8917587.1 ABC transporter substrate-binding protein [Nitratireductor rhodophyticola]MBY8922298.1 ABC transporter substrate-binding protein [Nitratireductor rhodophyticola]
MRRMLQSALAAALLTASAATVFAAEKVTYLFPAPDFLPAFAPFQLAKSKGYFEAADLDVTFQVGKGGADVATQVAVGNADLGGGIGDTPIIVRANGLDIRGVALLGGRGLTQLAWRKDSGITGPADLKGKSIGVLSFQDTTYYNLLAVLASAEMTKADADIQAVGAGGIIQLTIAGNLHAMSGVPEWIAAIEAAGVEMEQMPVDEVFPAMAQAIIASDKTIQERPEVVRGFVGAVLKAVGDIAADPAQAARDYVAAVPQHAGKEAEIEGILRSYATLVYPEGENQPLGAFDPERIASVQAFYVDNGIVQTAVPVEDLYTNEFVQ